MKMRRAGLGLGVLTAVSSAWAHHAFAAELDKTKPLQIARQGRQDGVDQSALLDSYRGFRRKDGQGDGMDDRVRATQRPAAPRHCLRVRRFWCPARRRRTIPSGLTAAAAPSRMEANCF
jgi:hypothetical protein